MNKLIALVVGAVIVVILLMYSTTYTVAFHEVAIKTRFGQADGIVTDPGLHWKLPFFIDRVIKLDKRLQVLDSSLETVQTADGQQLLVQAYLMWRISDTPEALMKFNKSYSSIEEASKTLETQLLSALRVVGSARFDELVGNGAKLDGVEKLVLAEIGKNAPSGIEPVTVGLAQVVLPPKTTTAVLRRMQATQERLATRENSRGRAEAATIRSAAATKADKIRSFAEARAQEIIAKGQQEATKYYEQMKPNEDLAIFLAWLDAFKASLNSNATLIYDDRHAPFHILNSDGALSDGGIPLPAEEYFPTSPPSAAPAKAKGAPPTAPDAATAKPAANRAGEAGTPGAGAGS